MSVTPTTPTLLSSGKVRDTYRGEGSNLLTVVASDRISVFDVVLPQLVPGKGRVLTHMTEYWLTETPVADVMPHHFLSTHPGCLPTWADSPDYAGRTMAVQRLDMLPIEAIVRGYLTGSGWKDYQSTGTVCGIELPAGMVEMDQFPEPIFTPSTKATEGHDQNIDFERMVELLGGDRELAEQVRAMSLKIYQVGAAYALERGIILVDTKLEFGINPNSGELVLGDEVLTPDSSRFVRAEDYEPGKPPKSMDKQVVRDWAAATGWNKQPPAPNMPQEVIDQTVACYSEISLRLTGIDPLATA